MESLNIEKFNPKKAELVTLAERYKNLTINGVDDKTGYLQVDTARKDVKKVISDIKKTGLSIRDDANKFVKNVIQVEKDLIGVIEPIRLELEGKLAEIDIEKEKQKRMAQAPERKAKLAEINITVEDDFILLMDDSRFNEFYFQKKSAYHEEQARIAKEEADAREVEAKRIRDIEESKLQAERDKLAEERRKLDEDKRIEDAKRKAADDARLKAERDAKLAADKAEQDKKDALAKAEKEKQDLIDAQARKEQERIDAENKAKQDELDRLESIKKENERNEKLKKYQKFLKDNGADGAIIHELPPVDSIVNRQGNKFTLYKKIAEITI